MNTANLKMQQPNETYDLVSPSRILMINETREYLKQFGLAKTVKNLQSIGMDLDAIERLLCQIQEIQHSPRIAIKEM